MDAMVRDGLLDEVSHLVAQYGAACATFDAIGYRELLEFFDGKISLENAIALTKMNTWHYAKRQMTWFKKDKTIRWIATADQASPLIEQFLK
jgi:tRNA dimethylallyltransferase